MKKIYDLRIENLFIMPSRRSASSRSRSGSNRSGSNRSGSGSRSNGSATRRAEAITRAMGELAVTPIRHAGTPLHNLRTPNENILGSPLNHGTPPASFGRFGVHGARRPVINSPNRPRVRRVIFPPNVSRNHSTELNTEMASRSASRNNSTELATEIASPHPLPRRRPRNESGSRSRNGSNRSPPLRRQRS